MPIVRMPDGKQVRFPDEMPTDEIKGIIASKYPKLGVADTAADASASLASGAVKGTRGLAELPADASKGAQWLANKASNYLGYGDVELPDSKWLGPLAAPIKGSQHLQKFLQSEDPIAQGVRTVEGYAPKSELGKAAKHVGEFLPGAAGGGAGAAARIAKYALAPGLGAYTGNKVGGEIGEAVGGLAGLAGGSYGVNKVAEKIARRGMKTADEFADEGTATYEAMKKMGLQIEDSKMASFGPELENSLKAANYTPGLHTKARAAIDSVLLDITKDRFGGKPMSFENLDKVQQRLMQNIKDLPGDDKGNRRILYTAKSFVDDFIHDLKDTEVFTKARNNPGGFTTGLAVRPEELAETKALLSKGKDMWKRKSKLELVDQMEDRAEHTGRAVYTRGGVEHADRREALNYLRKNPNKRQSLTQDELAAMGKVADQGPISNMARGLAKYADNPLATLSTGGVGTYLGWLAGGPLGAALGGAATLGAGYGGRALHKLSVKKAKNDLRSIIINGKKVDRNWNSILGKLQSLNTIRTD